MKKRNIALIYVFSILTCGIYGLYWYCSFQNQLKKETGMGFGGFGHLMASLFTFGIYALIWQYNAGERLEKAGGQNHGLAYLILTLIGLGFVNVGLMQHEANKLS